MEVKNSETNRISLLNNIKSNYFLKKLFQNLTQKKLLKIIKYNKNLQKLLDIGLSDFRIYYEEIEIEIILLNEQKNEKKVKFINLPKEFESHYRVYFNNDKDDKKRNYLTKDDKVEKIKIVLDNEIKSFQGLFKECEKLEKITFAKFNRKDIINMSFMFCGCLLLKEINFKNFITDNVINMNYMFAGCTSLTILNLSNFNTKNVTNLFSMFQSCSALKEINFSNFNTDNVTDMAFMFSFCKSLKKVDISKFNTEKVEHFDFMFQGCLALEDIDVSNFIIKKNADIMCMFSECSEELKNKIRNQNQNITEDAFQNSYSPIINI